MADDLTTIGRLYFELGRFEEAELEFRSILRKDLSHIPALLGLGRVCQVTANWRDAALCFRRILNLVPFHRIALEHLAELHLQQNLLDEAQGALEDGQRSQAVRIYKLVLRLDPAHPQAIHQLGQLGEQPDP